MGFEPMNNGFAGRRVTTSPSVLEDPSNNKTHCSLAVGTMDYENLRSINSPCPVTHQDNNTDTNASRSWASRQPFRYCTASNAGRQAENLDFAKNLVF